jgi:SAM-dependent methyltransferase
MNDDVIRQEIAKHKWYQPVDLGNGVSTNNWAGDHTKASYEFGLKKWRYIIERNLPDIQGLRVLDIGCNCGLYCIQMARMGAREVVGIDSDATWASWKDQACFIKEVLEWRCQAKYNIEFIDSSMTKIPDLNLGKFDLVIALCSIYYISENEIYDLLSYFKYQDTSTIILQGNTNKKDQSLEVYRKARPKYLRKILNKSGYKYTYIDEPLFYSRPVVVGSDIPIRSPEQSKRDKLRDRWRKIF